MCLPGVRPAGQARAARQGAPALGRARLLCLEQNLNGGTQRMIAACPAHGASPLPLFHRTCHIAIGTPGRVGALLTCGALATEPLRLLVLDEADALVDAGFYDDVAWIARALPVRKQVTAACAAVRGAGAPHTRHQRLAAAAVLAR